MTSLFNSSSHSGLLWTVFNFVLGVFWVSCRDCTCTPPALWLVHFLVRCIAKACGAPFRIKCDHISVCFSTYWLEHAGITRFFACLFHYHPHISLPSVPHSLFLSSGLMVSTWSTCKGSRASSSFVKLRRPRGSGWSSLTWPCEYDCMEGLTTV